MYKLGRDDGTGGLPGNDPDRVREYYRVASADVSLCQSFPPSPADGPSAGAQIERALGLCRYIADRLLAVALGVPLKRRPGSKPASFMSEEPRPAKRDGDFSLLCVCPPPGRRPSGTNPLPPADPHSPSRPLLRYAMNYYTAPECLEWAREEGM